MTDMKTTFLGLLLLTATAISAQEQARTFQLADAPRYSEETGYGYDLAPTPEKGSKAPFFFSVRVPDGNYKVTVRLGSKKQAGVTTVRGESRRLFIDNLPTRKGQYHKRRHLSSTNGIHAYPTKNRYASNPVKRRN